jgi:membrane-bound lytic murein transglycosylase B
MRVLPAAAGLVFLLAQQVPPVAPQVPPVAPQVPPVAPQVPPVAPQPQPSFEEWLAGVRTEALALGIGQATLDGALTGIEPVATVIERDRTQA